jgi:hypothetical protein
MKSLSRLLPVLFLVSCAPQEPQETKAIKEYVELNTENPKSYEPVQTVPAEFSDLYQLPDVSDQLSSVENAEVRIYYLLQDMVMAYGSLLPDSVRVTITELPNVFEDVSLEKFHVANIYLNRIPPLLQEFNKINDKLQGPDLQNYLLFIAEFEGLSDKLQAEVNHLFGVVEQDLGINGYEELADAMNTGEVVYHKYQIEEDGIPEPRSAIFVIRRGKVKASIPVELSEL